MKVRAGERGDYEEKKSARINEGLRASTANGMGMRGGDLFLGHLYDPRI